MSRGAGLLPWSAPCCTEMFQQQPRVDKPNTGPREGLLHFWYILAAIVGESEVRIFSCLQFGTSPLEATESYTLAL